MKIKTDDGFTLIELIVVIAILGVLSAVSTPILLNHIENAKYAVDLQTVQHLNTATHAYESGGPSPNQFEDTGYDNQSLMLVLVDEGLFQEVPQAKVEDAWFDWDFDGDEWTLSFSRTLTADEVTFITSGGHKGFLTKYSGSATKITIPNSLDGVAVTQIYQDAFADKSLTSVAFSDDTSVTRIHARAFKDNKLTELTFPDTLQRIDYGAFLGNSITKITIGSGVYFEGGVINGNDDFKTTYEAQGAGTYTYVSGSWVKQ